MSIRSTMKARILLAISMMAGLAWGQVSPLERAMGDLRTWQVAMEMAHLDYGVFPDHVVGIFALGAFLTRVSPFLRAST